MLRGCSIRIAALGLFGVLLIGPAAARSQTRVPRPQGPTATAAATKRIVQLEPKAVAVLKAVRARLAAATTLSFVIVETSESLNGAGTPLAFRRQSEVTLEWPDKARVIIAGDRSQAQVNCNGRTMLKYSAAEKALVVDKAPPTIDACLRNAYEGSAMTPILDVVAGDPSRSLPSGLTHAHYFGQRTVGATTTDIVSFSRNRVFVQMWVGTEDKLPRQIHVTYVDDPNRVRHMVALSGWKIDVPLQPDVFTLLKVAGGERAGSTEPRPVGTSGVQPAPKDRLTLHTYAPKYWGSSAPAANQTMPNGVTGYYHSPDGFGYYTPGYYGYYPPPAPESSEYYEAPCYDCGYDWASEGAGVNNAGESSFNISLTAPGSYNPGSYNNADAQAGYNNQVTGAYYYVPGQPTYMPGQIVTSLPVGCAAPYTQGAAFYLCGNTWFSGVYGPDGKLYYRAVSVP